MKKKYYLMIRYQLITFCINILKLGFDEPSDPLAY